MGAGHAPRHLLDEEVQVRLGHPLSRPRLDHPFPSLSVVADAERVQTFGVPV